MTDVVHGKDGCIISMRNYSGKERGTAVYASGGNDYNDGYDEEISNECFLLQRQKKSLR